MVNHKKKRISRTIPFGYKLIDNSNLLQPINQELRILNEIKKEILNGNLSLRKGAKEIANKTGRYLSHPGLRVILNKEFAGWQNIARKKQEKLKIEKKKLLEATKKKIIEEKELEKQRIKNLKKIKYKNCTICDERKLESEFIQNKSKYCLKCKILLLEMSQNLFLCCRICGNKKKLEEFIGTNGHNKYKTKTCGPCFREYHREWDKKNKYKRLKINRKTKLFGSSDIKKKKFLW